ncbi:MAG: ATP-binding protein [Candidatus Saccharimonadales bacterium]
MNIREALSQLKQDRSVYVVQVIIATAVIIDYSITDTITTSLGNLFYLLPALGIVPALFFPVGDFTAPRVKSLLMILHHSIAAVLLIFFTDIFGPYFQILTLLLFTSVIWYGKFGAIGSLLTSYGTIVAAVMVQFGGFSADLIYQTTLYMAGLTFLAILFERVVAYQQAETNTHKQDNQSLYFERARLLRLINSMRDAVVATDKKGKILLYNGAVLELFDTNETLQDLNINELAGFKNSKKESVDLITDAIKAGGSLMRDDVSFDAGDGSSINLSINISAISTSGADREQEGFIILLRDITKKKSLDEQKDEFISVASHELRTPIAIAEANISTAMLPKFANQLTDDGKELLEQAHENVVFLSNLVDDLHVLAMAERGRLQLKVGEIDIQEFLKKTVDDYSKQAGEKGLKLKLDIDKDIGSIWTSLDAIKEVMQNFLTNAIKYTESGDIILAAHLDKDDDGGVVISVKDSGIGISVADQKHVFEKFYRSEDYRTRKSGGTGLGLYITKRLIESMGGRVWFESKLNKGSTFYCMIPKHPKTRVDKEDGGDREKTSS